jgi:DNA repair exonuclease SbcCD ATPase subunit
MSVELNTEYLIPLVAAIIAWLLYSVRANTKSAQVVGKLMDSVIKFNDEIQEMSAARAKWDNERGELTRVVGDLNAQIKTIQDDCTERESTISAKLSEIEQRSQKREREMHAEIERLKSKIASLENEIDRLEQELKVERDLRRRDLETFDAQLKEKNEQIAQLKKERQQLIERLDELETKMNGKVDKSPPPVTGAAGDTDKSKETNPNED